MRVLTAPLGVVLSDDSTDSWIIGTPIPVTIVPDDLRYQPSVGQSVS